MKVVVFQWPCGTLSTSRLPCGALPYRRVILVVAAVSSMKISCFGSRVSCSFRKALRAAATSGRSCSAACTLFFKGQVDVAEEPRNPRLAHLHLFFRQANLKLCKRTIRLFRYKFLNQICMRLKQESLVPAELVWTDTARFALTLDESANRTQSHVVQLSNFLTGMTGFNCRNDTFTQIVGIRLPHSSLAPLSQWGS